MGRLLEKSRQEMRGPEGKDQQKNGAKDTDLDNIKAALMRKETELGLS